MSTSRRIDRRTLEYVVRLSRIDPTPQALGPQPEGLEKILRYMERLQALDTRGVSPTSHPHELLNRPREDRPLPGLPIAEALQNAPELAGGALFRTPRVRDE